MAIKVSENNYGFNKDNGILTIPFYQFPFLASDISKEDFDHTRFIKQSNREWNIPLIMGV